MIHNEEARRRQQLAEAEARDDMLTEVVVTGRGRHRLYARDLRDLLLLRAFVQHEHKRKSAGRESHGRQRPARGDDRVIHPYERAHA